MIEAYLEFGMIFGFALVLCGMLFYLQSRNKTHADQAVRNTREKINEYVESAQESHRLGRESIQISQKRLLMDQELLQAHKETNQLLQRIALELEKRNG